jgi:hypothetical protein
LVFYYFYNSKEMKWMDASLVSMKEYKWSLVDLAACYNILLLGSDLLLAGILVQDIPTLAFLKVEACRAISTIHIFGIPKS